MLYQLKDFFIILFACLWDLIMYMVYELQNPFKIEAIVANSI